ncbi:MAG: hypothetical protein JNG84_12170 [Archangium sp.]|nr:hypothetical protein [Archangium sp.]
MMKPVSVIALAAALLGCPAVNSRPCATDLECAADQRCRRGACGPLCVDDSECGTAQVCRSGTCALRPECAADTDCATGFECRDERCACLDDASCLANQRCLAGACETRARCTGDRDCLGKGHCEVTQGVCLPSCVQASDCAPQLDPNIALGIYACVSSACTRRCLTDATCGGQGLICAAGLCRVADCKTRGDCPAEQYCTSASFGRCATYTACTDTSECLRNFQCRRFTANECPPGFDCTQSICQELPQCFADGDCVTGVPGTPTAQQTGFCSEGHCQPTTSCTTSSQCTTAQRCIGQLCVPFVCRGHAECGDGKACVDGACSEGPAPAQIFQLRVSPTRLLLEVGDSAQLHLLAFRLDGTSFPLASGAFTVVDAQGLPSADASVTAQGRVTAVSPGAVTVRAQVAGSTVGPVEVSVVMVAPVTAGRRVVVVDAATKRPRANAAVVGCEGVCATHVEVVTGADGVALFPTLGTGSASFSVAASELRADGLPAYERVSVIATSAADVYVPLRANGVEASAGFNVSLAFTQVSSSGSSWAGFVASSIDDVPSVRPADLLGENFLVTIDTINQRVPIPASLVVYTSPAFGFPQEVKERSYGRADPGTRFLAGYAGRASIDELVSLRSLDFLGYLGAFDIALDANVPVEVRLDVPDTTDINGNGLCTSITRCPMGTEKVADYANFTRRSMTPNRPQQRRTEVVLPRVANDVAAVMVAAVELDAEAGMLPVGFTSRTPGTPGMDGTRAVETVTLRSGPPYNGIEIARPGVWAVATDSQGTAVSARLQTAASLPERVLVAPFLPSPGRPSFTPATRTLSPAQPEWASVHSSGGELARLTVSGATQQHAVYFAIGAGQTAVALPPAPTSGGDDPAGQAVPRLELVAMDLVSGLSVDDVLTLRGVNLTTLTQGLDGYCRVDR